ncbi:diguanylate cyclase [Solidesulfovibrio sp.]|uniref:diguanylate cyclase response regulator n=1 Tax=Solidesulfovibrio sp. TaxID=2910990 RepID=UPI002B213556|nr:diguanylate cyclase [Solidesulfovibrio sp.]MEA4855568.1 diguanylate cyclase [Solidesulfovibrio sp.]
MTDKPQCLFPRPQKIMLLSPEADLPALFARAFSPAEAEVTTLSCGRGAVELLFIDPPDLLVVDQKLPDIAGLELVAMVKSENVYRQLPVAVVMDEGALDRDIDWCAAEVDELLTRPLTAPMLRARATLALARASRSLDANPLTKLPGNTSIIARIQELIDRREDFALAYADLDYFKSFNDKYGFSRGDEVLMMTARILVNTVRAVGGHKAFVGHVGGDDFVFIMAPDLVEAACAAVVKSFDDIVPHFYDAEDRQRGFIQSVDREGNRRAFPLMAVSIAVVFNRDGRLKHYGEASQAAMTLKKKAKENPKSCYVLDKRQA